MGHSPRHDRVHGVDVRALAAALPGGGGRSCRPGSSSTTELAHRCGVALIPGGLDRDHRRRGWQGARLLLDLPGEFRSPLPIGLTLTYRPRRGTRWMLRAAREGRRGVAAVDPGSVGRAVQSRQAVHVRARSRG